MLRFQTRLIAGLIAAAACTSAANAQYWPAADACCGQVSAPPMLAMNPCCNPQPVCMQAIPQTVYRDVPVTEVRAVKKTVQMPVCKTVYVDQPVTVMRQVMQTKTCDVQSVSYQNVTECRQVCQNRGYWQTTMQPVPKMAPCQYDSRPTLLGELNRLGYSTRMAFTPDYIPRRDYVPQMQMVNVQVNRVVAVPTVRQVSYNVATMVPEQTTQRVAKVITEMQPQEVTVMEPFTTTRRMAVGTTYQYAYLNPMGGGPVHAHAPTPGGMTAEAAPTPAEAGVPKRAEAESFKGISAPNQQYQGEAQPTLADPVGPVASAPKTLKVHSVGWRSTREPAAAAN